MNSESISSPTAPRAWPKGFHGAPWRLVSAKQTWRAVASSVLLGLAALPTLIACIVMLPWIPLIARVVAAGARRLAAWLKVDVTPRTGNRWFDWQELYHLIIQLLLAAAALVVCGTSIILDAALIIVPFVTDKVQGGAVSIGTWHTSNPVVVLAICWPLAALILMVLAYASWLIAGASAASCALLLSPSAEEIAQLEASRATLIDAFSGERKRIERALHDGPQQHLTALKLNLAAAELTLSHSRDADPTLITALQSAQHNAALALRELRATVRATSPQVLYDLGVRAAVDELLAHSGLDTTLKVAGSERALGETHALLAYHCVAEGLTNASKHGGASAVTVELDWHHPTRLAIAVSDNGAGPNEFKSDAAATGIAGLRERAKALGGTVTFGASRLGRNSHGGPGATLRMTLPTPKEISR